MIRGDGMKSRALIRIALLNLIWKISAAVNETICPITVAYAAPPYSHFRETEQTVDKYRVKDNICDRAEYLRYCRAKRMPRCLKQLLKNGEHHIPNESTQQMLKYSVPIADITALSV